ncbi:MAG: helix-turn-helix domain-containing protein [Campylobacteraceae bacterium]|jgi:predicted transcriptional regulator|nr:helix-turn-helix domain-containing protein [Campylobacteraceae bacterium]
MSENIVKQTCKELGITQKELAEMLDIPQPTLARWQAGDITKMAQKALELLLENKQLKAKLQKIKEAQNILNNL